MSPSLLLLSLLACIGFFITYKIKKMMRPQNDFVCPVGGNCEAVLTSKYNSIFGIPNIFLGACFYFAILLYGISFSTLGSFVFFGIPLFYFVILASVAATSFSLYLIHIQKNILKEWCSWCLCSAVINTLILLTLLILF